MTLRPGNDVALVDHCVHGARVRSTRRLRPGARVHVQLTTGWRRGGLGAHVLRCSVASIDASGVLYSGALQFEHRCNVLWEELTRHGYELPADSRIVRHHRGHGLPHGHAHASLCETRE